ncbi:NACHT domain-containing protein [Streptomyces sp. NBC_01764]|uniref:NACHT domain-containing protein n=1 Tax=Streptomyces sp. NBC_01764 TaxID=2975935 RepID=UPI00224CEBB0|nr:NACHT domain-containing protein [Streptomyces sp. NBC_01764]MCX4411191.1 NACHT domain-containing protein [Streptomyces sp. NBC_01764]
MDPVLLSGARLASRTAAPLIKKLFVQDGPGAGLVDKPMRISGLISFRGEKRSLTEKDLRRIATRLVNAALRTGEQPIAYEERQAVIDAVTATLAALGELTLTDVAAVRLGAEPFARELRTAAGRPERQLSADATYLYERLVDDACVHILNFFTQRSQFVARGHVEQTRLLAEVIAKIDELIARSPLPGARDAEFEERYFAYITTKHSKLTIYGIDLLDTPRKWPIDATYLSLKVMEPQLETFVAQSHLASHGVSVGSLSHDSATGPHSADRVLAGHERVLLRGVAGSGKTTLVQWLALSAARQDLADPTDPMAYLDDRVPFVLPLRYLTRHGEPLPSSPGSFLTAIGCGVRDTEPGGWADRVLRAGRGLLLVDGIDEVPEVERPRARAWLAELMSLYPGNYWLVTSRTSAVPEGWLDDEGFTELLLAPMREAEITSFIGRWHSAARTGDEEQDAQLAAYQTKLLEAVHSKPELGRLATNPLMCGLICALQRDRRGYLPGSRRELYEAALAMLLVRRDRERDISLPEVSQEAMVGVLEQLAYHLILNGRTELDRSRAVSIIGKALNSVPELRDTLGDASAVLSHFLERSGLLTDPDRDTVVFIHRTFQDYLGARHAVSEGHFGVLGEHGADEQWDDVIRMAVAHGRPRERAEIFEELLRAADKARDSAARDRVHLVAAAALEQAKGGLARWIEERVEERAASLIPPRDAAGARELAAAGPVVLDLLPRPEHLDDTTAELVVIAASHVPGNRALPFLARYASHASLGVRSQLVWAWQRYDTSRYAKEIIARLASGGLYYTVTTESQLEALAAMGTRPMLDVQGPVRPAALAAYTANAELTHFRLLGTKDFENLSFLRGQSRLTEISISHRGDLLDVSELGAMEQLTTFTLTMNSAFDQVVFALDALCPHAPLRFLTLGGVVVEEGGFQQLAHFPELLTLSIAHTGSRSPSDWDAIAALPRLQELSVADHTLNSAPSTISLNTLEKLHVAYMGGRPTALENLPELCPALQHLTLSATSPDLAPLAALPHLRVVRLAADAVPCGADQLPSTVRVIQG